MGKLFEYNLGEDLYRRAKRPIRKKQDLILLLLETIKVFLVGDIIGEDTCYGRLILKIDKMSRIFFCLGDKIFTFSFPFFAEYIENTDKSLRIYVPNSSIELDHRIIAILIGFFTKADMNPDSLDQLLLDYSEMHGLYEPQDMDLVMMMLQKLILFESGYLRYDHDPENENDMFHPLNHIDIFFSTGNTFKLGLTNRVDHKELINILDITCNCLYLK